MTREADEIGIPVKPTSRPWGDPTTPGGKGAALLIRDRKQLFLDDDFLVESATRIRKVMHQPVKHTNNPVMLADKSWERGSGINGGAVLYDEGRWKMWYRPSLATEHGSTAPVAYATSEDGIRWHKPDLGLVEFEGSKKNNLIVDSVTAGGWHSHGGKVFKDTGQTERDPKRRFKMFLTVIRRAAPRCGFMVAFSADGIHWEIESEPVVVDHEKHYGAFNTAFYDDTLEKYVAYMQRRPQLKFLYPQYAVARRHVARMESDDFIHWTDSNYLAFGPDDRDPDGADLWESSPFQYREAGYAYFNIALWFDYYRDMIWARLATSRDNLLWRWAGDRQPFIPNGQTGSFDARIIHPVFTPAVVKDDMIHIYYAGWGRDGVAEGMDAIKPGTKSSLAAGDPGTRARNIGLAQLRLDGFVSLEAGVLPGCVTTWPLVFKGSVLELNVDARRIVRTDSIDHGVRVEVTDPLGRVIPGCSIEDCDPIHDDSVRRRVTWHGSDDVSRIAGQPVKLRFCMCYASLYAFQFKDG